MNNSSCWGEAEMPVFPILKENQEADVCIVGAGIAGLSTAYTLAREGKSVIVIEKNGVGSGQTALTTAHISNVLDWRYFELEKLYGDSRTSMVGKSHTEAINFIEEIVTKEKIDCDFARVDGYLFGDTESEHKILDREYKTVAKLHITPVHRVERAPLENFDTGSCLQFPNQAQFHPMKYMAGLANVLKAQGVKIYTQTPVSSVKEDKTGVIIQTQSGRTIKAQQAVIATNTPFIDRYSMHSKQVAMRTYVIGLQIPKNSVKKALYWDTLNPYHYVRIHQDSALSHDILIVGGEDHGTGKEVETEDNYKKLFDWSQKRFPKAEKIHFQWSGQVFEPLDKLAYIGLNPGSKKIYIITGEAGNGITYATIGSMLLADLLTGKQNPLAALYKPSRKPLKVLGKFLWNYMEVLWGWSVELVSGSKTKSFKEIQKDSGAVITKGLQKIAVYKNKDGEVFQCTAVCPHLGCFVKWNNGEKTWDCPCHGSRFTAKGKLLNGPAISDLKSLD